MVTPLCEGHPQLNNNHMDWLDQRAEQRTYQHLLDISWTRPLGPASMAVNQDPVLTAAHLDTVTIINSHSSALFHAVLL